MKTLFIYFVFAAGFLSAQTTPNFSIMGTEGKTLTCYFPQLTFTANTISGPPVTYTWASASFTTTGTTATLSSPGNYTVTAMSGSSVSTQTLGISVNTVIPISSASSTFQQLTGTASPQAFTFTAVSPSLNITHYIYSPQGGTMVASSYSVTYVPGGAGTYTHCILDDVNGCRSCQPFVFAPPGAPSTVGLEEYSLNDTRVFPNPSTGLFNILLKNANESDLRLYNSVGQLLKAQQAVADVTVIDLQEQPSGIYILKVATHTNAVRCVKLIKE